jgi:hypothetical protein
MIASLRRLAGANEEGMVELGDMTHDAGSYPLRADPRGPRTRRPRTRREYLAFLRWSSEG